MELRQKRLSIATYVLTGILGVSHVLLSLVGSLLMPEKPEHATAEDLAAVRDLLSFVIVCKSAQMVLAAATLIVTIKYLLSLNHADTSAASRPSSPSNRAAAIVILVIVGGYAALGLFQIALAVFAASLM